jgi:hypothetical protein
MNTTERNAIIQGLRELAAFLTENPTLPITAHQVNEFMDTREEWDALRTVSAGLAVVKTDDFFVLRKLFPGGVRYDVCVERPREDDDTLPSTASFP